MGKLRVLRGMSRDVGARYCLSFALTDYETRNLTTTGNGRSLRRPRCRGPRKKRCCPERCPGVCGGARRAGVAAVDAAMFSCLI